MQSRSHSMKRRNLSVLAACLVFACGYALAQSPSLDDIIANNLKARGGADKIRAVKSIRYTGKTTAGGRGGGGGLEVTMIEEYVWPNKVRREQTGGRGS